MRLVIRKKIIEKNPIKGTRDPGIESRAKAHLEASNRYRKSLNQLPLNSPLRENEKFSQKLKNLL